MFSECSSLTSIDLSNFNKKKYTSGDLFKNCFKLSYIDISPFIDIIDLTSATFLNISKSGIIKVNKDFSIKIQPLFNQLNINWTIL